MKYFLKLFTVGYFLVGAIFFICGVALLGVAGGELWHAIHPATDMEPEARLIQILECIGVLTISVAAFELGQTVLEEEVMRSANISAPTRVRRFLSRFLIVVIVSLSIECLVAVYQFLHKAPELLPQAASIGAAAAFLLVAWGVFVRLNIFAEHMEPEAAREAKAEDDEIEGSAA